MNYQTFSPCAELQSFVKCYWTLEVPADANAQRQRIVPDGCIEMAFLLGADIKRYTSETYFVLQPRAMVIGQIIDPFYIEPTGYVNSFAVRFYPYGFANLVTVPISNLANQETPLANLFGEAPAQLLEQKIREGPDTSARIAAVENFLLELFQRKGTIDTIVKSTVEALLLSKGSTSIKQLINQDVPKRRQLERKFARQIGMSPKQLGKVVRLQSALKLMLNDAAENLTEVAYESGYYDQAHFNRDFKEFTGINPRQFLGDEKMQLASLFYRTE